MKGYLACFLAFISIMGLSSQEIELPEGVEKNFILIQDSTGAPSLVTRKGIYRFKNKWIKTNFKNILSKKDSLAIYSSYEFNNKNYTPLFLNNQPYFILNGGGFVLKLSNNELTRFDNSVDQKNQIGGAAFTYNNQLHVYGGYGLWAFKDYTTYFENSTKQWEYLASNSKETPLGRWKALYQVIDNKLFVLGGRASSKETTNIDVILDDYFVFDLYSKTFQNKGSYNPEIPITYANKQGFFLGGKKAYANKNELIIIDFLNEEMTRVNSKNLFEHLKDNSTIFESQDTLYYISAKKNKEYLSKLALTELSKFKNTTYSLIKRKKSQSYFFVIGTIVVVVFVTWLLFGLFRYKDFLKQLILFDNNKLYFDNHSIQISLKQHKTIARLSLKGQMTAIELNKIISSKNKFAKSHLTLLRQKFITDLNATFTTLTKAKNPLVLEEKDPKDRRYLVYKATQEVFTKPSLFTFLFTR